MAAEYRLDVKKFWVNENGKFSVWFYEEADKEDLIDGEFSWEDISPEMKFKDLLDLLIDPEPKHLVQHGLQRRARSFVAARLSVLTRKIGSIQ